MVKNQLSTPHSAHVSATERRQIIFLPFSPVFFPPDFAITVKDVRVSVPAAIRRGDNANLICHYDMEGAVLYSVKWYKGKREFFRYTPKENPSLKAFPLLGITVEVSV